MCGVQLLTESSASVCEKNNFRNNANNNNKRYEGYEHSMSEKQQQMQSKRAKRAATGDRTLSNEYKGKTN